MIFVFKFYSTKVHNLYDLLYDTNFDVGYVADPNNKAYLQSTSDPNLRELYRRSSKSKLVQNEKEGLARALNSKYAVFGEQRSFRRAIQHLQTKLLCDVSFIFEQIFLQSMSTICNIYIPSTHHSIYLALLNRQCSLFSLNFIK